MMEFDRHTQTGDEIIYTYRSAVAIILCVIYLAWTAAVGWGMWFPLATGGWATSQKGLMVAYYVGALLFAAYGIYGLVGVILAYMRGIVVLSDAGLTHRSPQGKTVFVPWSALQRVVRSNRSANEWTLYSLAVDFTDPEGKTRRLVLIQPLALFSPHVDYVAKAVVRRAGLSFQRRSRRRWFTYEDVWERS